jgi:hypothetical protein
MISSRKLILFGQKDCADLFIPHAREISGLGVCAAEAKSSTEVDNG